MSVTSPPAGQLQPERAVCPVIGHRWAVDLLSRQLAQGEVAHAYLFTGPAQVGKGTLARWFAQALLCQAEAGPPCGTCPACRKSAAGIHPDLRPLSLETQPGGRRRLGIESVREMRAGMAERPFSGRRKVYLIEDAESLTIEASNALLKTLEEPPPFVVLILVALSDHLLLPTIVSRCQPLLLRPLARREVRQALVERWGAPEEQADLLAAMSQGRLGWAVDALQHRQTIQQRWDDLEVLTRLLEAGLVERFAFAEKQDRNWRDGRQAAVIRLLEHWQGWWRDLLLVGEGCEDLVTNLDRTSGLRAAARRISPETALSFLQALHTAKQRLLEQVSPRLVFEDLFLQLPAVVA